MNDDTIGLSRRKMLVGLGAVGVASAGAGLGTTAYFNDTETFENNTLTAGQLDLAVDYQTSYEQGIAGSGGDSGTVNGNPTGYEYVIDDVKPGDSGQLVFCPQIVDNPAWLWVGTENGLTDYENGLTEPEAEVDDTDPADAGTVGSQNTGAGEGDLSEAILVTVSYCESDGEGGFETIRTLNNPSDYTLADLATELESGFLLDAGTDSGAYPASTEFGEQVGPCLCIDWNVPTTVENEIQTDAVTFDFSFHAEQERHNSDGGNSTANPYNGSS